MNNRSPKGSEWRKWDLHVHTPLSYENDFSGWDTYIRKLKGKAVVHDIEAVGINDYFSVDGYEKLLTECQKETMKLNPRIKLANGKWLYLFPVVELRLENFTDDSQSVNLHVVFSPDILPSTIRSSLLEKLTIKYQSLDLNCKSHDLAKIGHAEENQGNFDANLDLNIFNDREKTSLIHKALKVITLSSSIFEKGIEEFKKLLEKSGIQNDKYLIIVANKGLGGLDALSWHDKEKYLSRAGNIRQNLLNLANVCFSNDKNDIEFLLGKRADTPKDEILNRFRSCKPCIWGSDAHSEENLFYPSNGKTKDYTWIKADPTFEGLKQIPYEPQPGERVKISPVEPDQKDGYKIISKIRFTNTNDFPEEIELNKNLCSIIGSRSSGKSALLAYLAHSVDKEMTEDLVEGPGEGEDYHWKKIIVKHSIDWGNGKTNDETPGKVVYIPQNYLFKQSKNSDEIKEKIKPVLFNVLPDFKGEYERLEKNIYSYNQRISGQIDNWFELSDHISLLDEQLKNLGNKKAVDQEKREMTLKIKGLKEKYQLSAEDLKAYQKISSELLRHEGKIKEIDTELSQIPDVSETNDYFSEANINLSPSLSSLPKTLQYEIKEYLEEEEDRILNVVNKQVIEYRNTIGIQKSDAEEAILKLNKKHKDLIERYQKNIELEVNVKKLNEYNKVINKIGETETEKEKAKVKLEKYEKDIKSTIDQRKSLIKGLVTNLEEADQSILEGIKFGMEYGFEENIEELSQINIKEKSEFVERGKLRIKRIREKPGVFLFALYSGEQKIIKGNEEKQVAKDILTLTEKILLNAEMEGDRIGGFSEPTMTPGKRALFLLRLILAESQDTWPLLIDQPEDDLDSRSIYDDIVPFLKEKKKERQIIMVTHNANLVIGSDSEQVIVANRHGTDRKNEDGRQFNYLTGSLEYSKQKDNTSLDTLKSQGVCEHACQILDGGRIAFEQRKNRYNIK
jgi:energy-coupling factor transporter ATP-binding protein EcfA2